MTKMRMMVIGIKNLIMVADDLRDRGGKLDNLLAELGQLPGHLPVLGDVEGILRRRTKMMESQ
jgi:hypothetical protein